MTCGRCRSALETSCHARRGSEFDGFDNADLNVDVLNFSSVAWRNIHIIAVGAMKVGNLVVANHTRRGMHAQVAFEILDEKARPIDPAGARLLITPSGAALEKLREHRTDRPFLEDLGNGTFRVHARSQATAG